MHLRARDFDPATTAFTATDPLDGVDGTTTVAGAGYAYAGNDPVNLSDPSGLRPHDFSFLSDPTATSATSICSSDDNAAIAVFEKATGENCNAILDADKAGWVERNRHHLVNVTVFVAVAVACVATVGVGCVTAAAVGFAAGGALHGSADLIANDTSRNLSPGQAYRQAGESALGGAGAGAVLRPAATALKSSVQAKPVAEAATSGTVSSSGSSVVRYDPDFAVGQVARGGQARASDLGDFGASQGWRRTQSAGGPIKFVDDDGITRLTIKRGTLRAPGSGAPHIEIRNAAGQRIDVYGNPVTRRSPGNHTPIIWDLGT